MQPEPKEIIETAARLGLPFSAVRLAYGLATTQEQVSRYLCTTEGRRQLAQEMLIGAQDAADALRDYVTPATEAKYDLRKASDCERLRLYLCDELALGYDTIEGENVGAIIAAQGYQILDRDGVEALHDDCRSQIGDGNPQNEPGAEYVRVLQLVRFKLSAIEAGLTARADRTPARGWEEVETVRFLLKELGDLADRLHNRGEYAQKGGPL